MYSRHICVSVNDTIPLPQGGGILSGLLSEFARICREQNRVVVNVRRKSGEKHFSAGKYAGAVCFTDGTLLEILPKADGGKTDARNCLFTEFSRRCGYTYRPGSSDSDMNFLEFFISVFAGETMKIIKSGVLSSYTSREENMNSVQGTILFSENIRRNLVHHERLFVRHDVFTPDRAENRLIKAAGAMLIKLTADPHSSHLLKESLSYLDEVAVPQNISGEFARCINTRNTKKYSTILKMCRLLFDMNEGTSCSGKDIAFAQFFDL